MFLDMICICMFYRATPGKLGNIPSNTPNLLVFDDCK